MQLHLLLQKQTSQRMSQTIKQSSDLCYYVTQSEVACEVKEAFLGFDDVSNDRRATAIFFVFLFPFIHVCLFYMAYSQYYLVSL